MKNDIDVKRRTDLENKMYKSCELESVFLYFIYVHDNLNGNLPLSLTSNFSLVNKNNNTRSVIYRQLDKLRTRTITYGTNSIKSRAVEIWNFINKCFHTDNLFRVTCLQVTRVSGRRDTVISCRYKWFHSDNIREITSGT